MPALGAEQDTARTLTGKILVVDDDEGVTTTFARMVMEIVADSGLLTSLDLVEVNPTLDVRNATAQLGSELALSALGLKIL